MDFRCGDSRPGFLVRSIRVSLSKPKAITQKRSEIVSHGFRIFTDVLGLLSTDAIIGQAGKRFSLRTYLLWFYFVLDGSD